MTLRHKIELDALFCLVAVSIGVFAFFLIKDGNSASEIISPILADNASVATVTSVASSLPNVVIATQPSPDGTKKLLMKSTQNRNGAITYEISTSDSDGTNQHQLSLPPLSFGEHLSIPFNAWSPDDTYIYMQTDTGDAYVFNASGDSITQEEPYLNVRDLFTKSGKQDKYSVVTGWASPTLLIVNTTTDANTQGYSYWFEVPSKAIIQLSSRF